MATTFKELQELTADEIAKRIRDLKQESLNLRLQQATGQLENSARIRTVRREVARLKTALSAKTA